MDPRDWPLDPRDWPPVRRAGVLATLFGAIALAAAWIAQHLLSMTPCALCLLERWPYRALLALGLLAALAPNARFLLWLVIGAFLCAVAFSFIHVGVEQDWWPDPWPACMAPRFSGGSMAARLAAMPLRPVKPCDAPSRLFNFLPVSMTSLDLIYAVSTCMVTVLSLRLRRLR